MNEYLLIKYSDNWADEMDIEGFWITTKDEHDKWKTLITNHFESNTELRYYIGTNEEINYSSAQHVFGSIRERSINKDEYDMINQLFGKSYGFSDLACNIEE